MKRTSCAPAVTQRSVAGLELDTHLERWAQWRPHSLAVADERGRLTYRELDCRVDRLTNLLLNAGVKKGDRIGLLLGNRSEVFEGFYACARVGAVRVPLNTGDGVQESLHKIAVSEPRVLIAEQDSWQNMTSATNWKWPTGLESVLVLDCLCGLPVGDPRVGSYVEQMANSCEQKWHRTPIDGADLFRFGWTGGTTGRPKAVMRTVHNENAVLSNILSEVSDPNSSSVFLHAMPLAHGSGLLSIAYFARGAANVINAGFDPVKFAQSVSAWGVTDTFLVPTALYKLLDAKDKIAESDLKSLKTIMYGAARASSERLNTLIAWLGPRFVQVYGQAEATLTISVLRKEEHLMPSLLETAGRPSTRDDVVILDDAGSPVSTGELGEICVRGAHVMSGYWRDAKATEKATRGGWLHTDDLGRLSSEGYLEIVSRLSGVINSGGFNIYPAEVEEVLYGCDQIREVAVVGMRDDLWGEAVTAVIVPKVRADADETIRALGILAEKNLGRYNRPKRYIVWPDADLPKSPVGKVLHSEVKRLLQNVETNLGAE